MGFYINIFVSLHLCNTTGRPFYYGKRSEKIYEIPSIEVPTEYRRFLTEKNNIYCAYVRHQEGYYDTADRLYEEFPDWEQVKGEFPDAEECYDWTEEDHNLFYKALEWFARQEVMYLIVWG